MAKWFYLTDGQPTGPIDPAALKQLATSGRLKRTDKVRREDMSEWYEAKQVKGLFVSAQPQSQNDCALSTNSTMPPQLKPCQASLAVPDENGGTSIDDEEKIKSIVDKLRQWQGQRGFYHSPDIPAAKVNNARQKCAVPADENILGLIDCTVFGSASNALVFGQRAFYYHHTGGNVPDPGLISYVEFPAVNFRKKSINCISLGSDRYCKMAGSSIGRDKIIAMLDAVKSVVKRESVNKSAQTERRETDAAITSYSVMYRGGLPSQPKPMIPGVNNLLLRSGVSNILLGMNATVTFQVFGDRFELLPKGAFNGAVIPWNRVFALDVVAEQKVLLLTKRDNVHISYTPEDGSVAVINLQMVSGIIGSGEKKCQELVDCLRDHGIYKKFQAKPPEKPAEPCPHCGILIAAPDAPPVVVGQCPYCGRELAAPPVRSNGHHCPKCSGNDIKTFEYVHALGKKKATGSLTVGGGSGSLANLSNPVGAVVASLAGAALGAAHASGRVGTVTGLAEMCAPPEKAKWAALSPEKQEYNERIYPKKISVWKRSWICMNCGIHWVAAE